MVLFSVFSGRTGKFQIADDGVKGEGSYSLNNQTADIKLHLVIGGSLLRAPVVQATNVPMLKPLLKDTANRTQIDTKQQFQKIARNDADKNRTKQENTEQQGKEPAKIVKQVNVEQQEKEPVETVKQEKLSDQGNIF